MNRFVRIALASTVAVATLGVASAVASPASGATNSSAASSSSSCTNQVPKAAKLRLTISSSAPSANIHVSPGIMTARIDQSATGGATTGYVPDGVQVNLPAGKAGTIVTDEVTVDPTAAPNLTLSIDKTGSGITTVSVSSLSRTAPPVTLIATGAHASTTVDRNALYDPNYALPKADSRKLVLAAYYPWFNGTGWDKLQVSERPLDPRSVWSPAGVLSMTQQARDAGIDGFLVSWAGADATGEAWDDAASAASQTGGYVAPYIEVGEAMDKGGVPNVEKWLREALDRTGSSSVTNGGVPVVFVWNMARVSINDWNGILARLGRPVKLVGDGDTNVYGSAMWGFHSYLPPTDLTGAATRNTYLSGWFRGPAALNPQSKIMANIGTVSPGFDDRLLRGAAGMLVPRSNGRYDATWNAAVPADPDMVLVTSWNEWFESTSIEPGTVNGTTALNTTKARIAAWKGCTAAAGN